jgi:hypothetical protein
MFRSGELQEPGRASAEMWPPEWGYGSGFRNVPPEENPAISAGLAKLGNPAEAIAGVMDENLMRVADLVWK